jgi:ribonuclease VapC
LRSAVLDSYALVAFLQKESGSEKVVALLERAAAEGAKVLMCAPNWAEIRYIMARRFGEEGWVRLNTLLHSLPIEIVPADQALAEGAGRLKTTKRMSLADCFAAALARQRSAAVYTGDPEFKEVEEDIDVHWL